jgi:hypothetical protein
MKSSYTNPLEIEISIDLGIGEVQTIVTALEKIVEAGENSYSARELLKSLNAAKSESVRQLRDSLKHYA